MMLQMRSHDLFLSLFVVLEFQFFLETLEIQEGRTK